MRFKAHSATSARYSTRHVVTRFAARGDMNQVVALRCVHTVTQCAETIPLYFNFCSQEVEATLLSIPRDAAMVHLRTAHPGFEMHVSKQKHGPIEICPDH